MPSLHGSRLCTDYDGLEESWKVQHGSTVYLFYILLLLGLHAELNSASARRALSWALFNYTLECWGESSVQKTKYRWGQCLAQGCKKDPDWDGWSDTPPSQTDSAPGSPHQECVQHLLLQQKQARTDLELPFLDWSAGFVTDRRNREVVPGDCREWSGW